MRIFPLLIGVLGTLSTTQAGLRGTDPSFEVDDQRKLNLQSFGGNPNDRYPLNKCEGDCDNDNQCKNNLVCYQRNENDPVPGCIGGLQDGSRTDYCVNPDDINPSNTPQPVSNSTPQPTPQPVSGPTGAPPGPPLKSFGATPPGNRFPLGECEGDCDDDSDCKPGLKCYMRSNFDPVPGCSGVDSSRTDYCVKMNAGGPPSPTPEPTPEPTPAPVVPQPTPPAGLSNFRLKLYWELGYFWQEETFEREWCMQCRNSGCNYGNKIYIKSCSSSNQRFDFVPVDNTYILIQLHGTNLCFERDFKDIFLFTCDASNDRQLWFEQAGSFSGDRFEISPKTLSNHCITQRHHPKTDEEVELEPCTQARSGETSYWNRF